MTTRTSSHSIYTKGARDMSLAAAALAAGVGLLVMVATAPVSELYVFPKLIVSGNAEQTVKNIATHRTLFLLGMFGYLVTFLADIVVAWALYVLLRPVNASLSLLTAWFRLIYTVIALIALLNLVGIFRIVYGTVYQSLLAPGQINNEVMLRYYTFKHYWYFGLLFFAIHLGLLGYLVSASGYMPKLLGLLLLLCGLGYLLTTLQPFLFPGKNIDFARYTFYGELFFMLWLLIRGWRIRPLGNPPAEYDL